MKPRSHASLRVGGSGSFEAARLSADRRLQRIEVRFREKSNIISLLCTDHNFAL